MQRSLDLTRKRLNTPSHVKWQAYHGSSKKERSSGCFVTGTRISSRALERENTRRRWTIKPLASPSSRFVRSVSISFNVTLTMPLTDRHTGSIYPPFTYVYLASSQFKMHVECLRALRETRVCARVQRCRLSHCSTPE